MLEGLIVQRQGEVGAHHFAATLDPALDDALDHVVANQCNASFDASTRNP